MEPQAVGELSAFESSLFVPFENIENTSIWLSHIEKNILLSFENIDIDWKVNVLINFKILVDVDNIDCLFGKLRSDL